MKKLFAVIIGTFLAFQCVGCNFKNEISFPVDGLELNFKEFSVNGEDVLAFSYTNNTEYTIIRAGVTYSPKNNVTEERKKSLAVCTDKGDDICDLSISAYSLNCVSPGETSDVVPCDYINFADNGDYKEYYDTFAPKMMSVTYIDGDEIYTVQYDYKFDKHIVVEEMCRERYEWSKKAPAKYVDMPECVSTDVLNDSEKIFSFSACGIKKAVFEKYTEDLKNKGFVSEITEVEEESYVYEAQNGDGVKITVKFTDRNYYASPEYILCSVVLP